jgi:hypothetical protein
LATLPALLLAGLSAVGASGQLTAPRHALTSTTQTTVPRTVVSSDLEVVGNTLRLSSGTRFVVKGVEVYAVPFYLDGRAPDPTLAQFTAQVWSNPGALFAAIKATGANTVRIQVSSGVYVHNVYTSGGEAGYLARLTAIVDAATSQGLHVIVAWGDSLGYGAGLLTMYRTQFAMMRSVARALRDNRAVLYEPDNEPNAISWPQWLEVMEATIAFWQGTIGYGGPLIIDTRNFSWDFDPVYAAAIVKYDTELMGRSRIVFANHWYASGEPCFCGIYQKEWYSAVGSYTGQFPVLGTEYGLYDGVGPTDNVAWGRQFLDYLAKVAIPAGLNGACAFTWNWVGPNTMLAPSTGKLTAWGKIVVSDLLERHFAP